MKLIKIKVFNDWLSLTDLIKLCIYEMIQLEFTYDSKRFFCQKSILYILIKPGGVNDSNDQNCKNHKW